MASPRATVWLWLVLLTVCLVGQSPYFERMMNANERPRLLQAMALIDDGEWAIDGPAARGLNPGIDVARGTDGRLYPNKPPGATLPAALAWASLRAIEGDSVSLRRYTLTARFLGGALPILILCATLLVVCRRIAGDVPALAAVAVFALASPALSQARVLFGHSLTACLLFGGATLLLDARTPARAALGGFVAASAVGVEYLAAFAGLPLAWVVLRRARTRPWMAAASIAGALLPVLALGAYHDAVFGRPWSTGYHHVVRPEFAQVHAQGLLGLGWPSLDAAFEHLLSPWGGLLYFAPALALGVWPPRGGAGLARIGVVIFLTVLVVNLGLEQRGGWRVGPRYLVFALPFLVPSLALHLAGRVSNVRASVFIALVGFSAAVNFLAANLFPHLIPEGNPLADLLVPLWGSDPHGLARALGLGSPTLVLALVSAFALAWPLFRLGERPAHFARWVVPAGLVGALALWGLALRLPPAADGAANLRAVRRVWEPTTDQEPPSRALRFDLPADDLR